MAVKGIIIVLIILCILMGTYVIIWKSSQKSSQKKKLNMIKKRVTWWDQPFISLNKSKVVEEPIQNIMYRPRLPPAERQETILRLGALNPTDRPVTIGKQDLTPGLAGQGYSILS